VLATVTATENSQFTRYSLGFLKLAD